MSAIFPPHGFVPCLLTCPWCRTLPVKMGNGWRVMGGEEKKGNLHLCGSSFYCCSFCAPNYQYLKNFLYEIYAECLSSQWQQHQTDFCWSLTFPQKNFGLKTKLGPVKLQSSWQDKSHLSNLGWALYDGNNVLWLDYDACRAWGSQWAPAETRECKRLNLLKAT